MQPLADLDASGHDLVALQARDPDAWERLYRASRPTLWQFARSRLATDEQAEDAVSEAMTRAIGAVGRFRPTAAGLTPWLIGITRNVVNEMYRTGARHRRLRVEYEPAVEHSDRIVANDEAEAMRSAFATLPPDHQEVLALRVVAGLDADTTAGLLGKRPGAIRMAQSRALSALRTKLREVDR